MSLHRGALVVALLAALLNGGAVLADAAAGITPAEPAAPTAPASEPTSSPVPASPATQAIVAAQPSAPSTPPATAASPVARSAPGASASSMVSGLLFLLVLVLGAAWLIRRSGGMPALRGGSALKVVAALSLGPRERVVLIELGGQQWLLGVSGGSVNTLHHFEQPIVVGGNDDFAGKLRQFWPQGISSQRLGSQGLGSQGQGSQGPNK